MKILKSEVASGALLQDVPEFWRNLNLSQLKGKDRLGWSLDLPGALGICRALCGFDESQSGRWYAGFQKSFTIVGDVSRIFPMEIPQVPLDGQAGIVGQQDFSRPSRFLAPSQLRERRGP